MLHKVTEQKLLATAKKLAELPAVEAADALDELDNPAEVLLLFRLLPKDFAAEVFAFLDSDKQESIALAVSDQELKEILDELAFDDKIDFVEEMPANVVTKILAVTSKQERKLVNQFLNYPDNSAGSLMTLEFVELKENMTVAQSLEHVRRVGSEMETIYTIYVIDNERHLVGVLSLRELVIAPADQLIGEIATRNVVYAKTHDDQEEVAELFRKYDFIALPVVDNEKRLVGIITVDDIIDVVDSENTEDFHRIAGIVPGDEDYTHTSVWSEARRRFAWLLILMLSATITGNIIERYESVLASIIVLSAFIPMLMGTGGNAGAQASTVVIRSLSLGLFEPRDIIGVLWKEFRVSITVGLGLAAINYVRIIVLEGQPHLVALVVSCTLFLTVVVAKLLGTMLPVAAKTIGIDPAIMASPLITTLVDAFTLLIYFRIAVWLLPL